MKKTRTFTRRSIGSLLLASIVATLISCSSISEDMNATPETSDVYADLISRLDTYEWESDQAINARSSNAMPAFKTTMAILKAYSLHLSAVKDRATVFVPTDAAYAAIGINSKNVLDFPFLPAVVANQVISSTTVKGEDLVGTPLVNLLNAPLTVVEENGGLVVYDVFGNSAKIIRTDFNGLNSTTHFIDAVLVPAL